MKPRDKYEFTVCLMSAIKDLVFSQTPCAFIKFGTSIIRLHNHNTSTIIKLKTNEVKINRNAIVDTANNNISKLAHFE